MAEFEELRLTVNLVDNASAGLQRIRAEIGQLTTSAGQMTTAFAQAGTGVTQLGTAVTRAAPGVRTLQTEMRAMNRSAEEAGRGLSTMALAATQGAQAYPMLAMGIGQAVRGLAGMNASLATLAPAARVASLAIGGVAISVVALGAAVAIYGYQTFKFAKEMDNLAKTAKTMGLSFAELKNAQDQAKIFGQSAESVIRNMQGIQAAQLDLYKNNSSLRQRMLAQGVNADWIRELATADPTRAHNMIVEYGKALEKQAVSAGVGKTVARGIRNQFQQEFGISADAEIIKPPSPEMQRRLERIDETSAKIAKVWAEITRKWDEMTLEGFADALPYVLTAVETLSGWFDKIANATKTISESSKAIAEWWRSFTIPGVMGGTNETLPPSQQRGPRTPAESLSQGYRPISFGGGGGGDVDDKLQLIIKGGVFEALVEYAAFAQGGGAGGGGFQNAAFGGTAGAAAGGGFKSADGFKLLPNGSDVGAGTGAGAGASGAPGGGAGGAGGGGTTRGDRNNNPGNLKMGPLAQSFGATRADDKGFAIFPDRVSGAAAQEALIKSDRYKDLTLSQFAGKYAEGSPDWQRTVGKAMGIGPNDVVNNQDPRLQGAIQQAEGTNRGTRTGAAGDPAVPSEVLAEARRVSATGGPGAVSQYMREAGYPKSGAWCGQFAASVVKSAGGTPPQNPAIASNWRKYGTAVDTPQPGDVAVRRGARTGSTGSHVTFVEGVNVKTGQFTGLGGNQGRAGPSRNDYDINRFEFRRGPDRAELDRRAISRTQDVNATGKLKVDVNAPPSTKVEASGTGLFRDTELQRSTAMPYTGSGPSAADTANQFMGAP